MEGFSCPPYFFILSKVYHINKRIADVDISPEPDTLHPTGSIRKGIQLSVFY